MATKEYIERVMEVTTVSREMAQTALSMRDNNVTLAIEALLDEEEREEIRKRSYPQQLLATVSDRFQKTCERMRAMMDPQPPRMATTAPPINRCIAQGFPVASSSHPSQQEDAEGYVCVRPTNVPTIEDLLRPNPMDDLHVPEAPASERLPDTKPVPEPERLLETNPAPEPERLLDTNPAPEPERLLETNPAPEPERLLETKPAPEPERADEDTVPQSEGGSEVYSLDFEEDTKPPPAEPMSLRAGAEVVRASESFIRYVEDTTAQPAPLQFKEINSIARQLEDAIGSDTSPLAITVLGAPHSGKTMLINALLNGTLMLPRSVRLNLSVYNSATTSVVGITNDGSRSVDSLEGCDLWRMKVVERAQALKTSIENLIELGAVEAEVYYPRLLVPEGCYLKEDHAEDILAVVQAPRTLAIVLVNGLDDSVLNALCASPPANVIFVNNKADERKITRPDVEIFNVSSKKVLAEQMMLHASSIINLSTNFSTDDEAWKSFDSFEKALKQKAVTLNHDDLASRRRLLLKKKAELLSWAGRMEAKCDAEIRYWTTVRRGLELHVLEKFEHFANLIDQEVQRPLTGRQEEDETEEKQQEGPASSSSTSTRVEDRQDTQYVPSCSEYIPPARDYEVKPQDYVPKQSTFCPKACREEVELRTCTYVPPPEPDVKMPMYMPKDDSYVPRSSEYVPSEADTIPQELEEKLRKACFHSR